MESSTSGTLPKKRKSITSATAGTTGPSSNKRIKTETTSSAEPRVRELTENIADSIYDAIVSVRVGETATNFGIHRGLLRRASRFFRVELASSETSELGVVAQVVVMKDEKPDTFRRFKDWLYSGSIISESETYKSLTWSDVIAVYTFADRKGIPRLQNRCVETIIRKRKEGGLFPAQADVNTLWSASGQVSRLRRLLLEMFATECNLKNALATNRAYHPGFLRGLVQTLYDMKEEQSRDDEVDFWKKRQNYYVDDNENPIVVN